MNMKLVFSKYADSRELFFRPGWPVILKEGALWSRTQSKKLHLARENMHHLYSCGYGPLARTLSHIIFHGFENLARVLTA